MPGPRPFTPRPSTTSTANPWSANHCDMRCAPAAFSTRAPCGPPYGSISTGSGPSGSRPPGRNSAARSSRSPSVRKRGRGSIALVSETSSIVPTDSPERHTVATDFTPCGVAETRTSVPPPSAPECSPGSSDSRTGPPSGVQRHRWISVGSPSEARNSTPSPADSTTRTCRPGGVTGSPPTVSRYVSASASTTTSTTRPSARRTGASSVSSTHRGSVCSATTRVEPVDVSASRSRTVR